MLLAIVASWLTLGNVDFACETPEVPVILTHGTRKGKLWSRDRNLAILTHLQISPFHSV